jgi:hypothetical protein
MGYSGDSSTVHRQEGVRRSTNRKGRKRWRQLIRTKHSCSELGASSSPQPRCDLSYSSPPPHFQHHQNQTAKILSQCSGKKSYRCASVLPLPGAPSCFASWLAPLTSAQCTLLTFYQQLCVGAVLARLAAIGALVLRLHIMDDQAVSGTVAAHLILPPRAQLNPLP